MNALSRKFLFKDDHVININNIKKYLFFYVINIFTFQDFFSQNLVQNPSFEIYDTCPYFASQIHFAIPWVGTNNSTDYSNSCANDINPICGVPNSEGQVAKTGNAFATCYFYNGPNFNYREYVQGKFFSQLILDNYYLINLFIKPDRRSSIAVNNAGVYISSNSFTTPTLSEGNTVAPYNPQIVSFGNPIISDTSNWTKIEGIYKANGNENYITIGNFKDDEHTDTLNIGGAFSHISYYYIDDVSVEEISEPFWQYRDTTIHYGDSVLIGPALTGLDINWYTANDEFIANAPGIYVKPETSRNYIAKETFNDIETTHLVHVTVLGGLGLAVNELEQLVVYPNPNSGEFSLGGLFSGKTELKIINLAGQTVWLEEANFTQNEEKITVDLEKGVYFLEVRNLDSEKSVKRKIVID